MSHSTVQKPPRRSLITTIFHYNFIRKILEIIYLKINKDIRCVYIRAIIHFL